MNDPFANVPENDLPTDMPNNDVSVDPTDQAKVRGVESVVATYKGDGGAPWIVVHADSVETHLKVLSSPAFRKLLETTQSANEYYAGKYPGRPAGGSRGGSESRAAASLPPGVPAMNCDHGQRVYKSGKSAKGEWAGLFCPNDVKSCSVAWKGKDGNFAVR